MLAKPGIGLISTEIRTDMAWRGTEELPVPNSLEEIPGGNDGGEDDESPNHTTKDHET
jgi:hypothetical protein